MNEAYIVFEGLVGSGKTTQSKLVAERLREKYPNRDVVWGKEPGGSPIANEIRRVVQGMEFDEQMDPVCESFLYAASRAQTLRKIAKPILDTGGIFVSDRSIFSSLVNQGIGRGLGIETVWEINKVAVAGLLPGIVFFLDLEVDVAMSRIADEKGDKFESLGREFHEKLRDGYHDLVKKYPQLFNVIDASGSAEDVFSRIWSILDRS